MSVNCKRSELYEPLIKAWRNLPDFEKRIREHFLDADDILRDYSSGNSTPTTISSFVPITTGSNPDLYFAANVDRKNKFEKSFASKILSFTVFEKTDEGLKLISENVNDLVNGKNISILNEKILNYKKSLLQILAKKLNEDIALDSVSPEELLHIEQELLNLTDYKNAYNDDADVYDAYVTLKCFDKLLKITPFVEIDKKYKNIPYHPNRYIYTGPKAKQDNNWGGSEHSDAIDGMGDLTKIILDNVPLVDVNGNDKIGETLGKPGFLSAMLKVRKWAQETNLKDADGYEIKFDDITTDWVYVIDKYLEGNHTSEQKTTLKDHLRSVRKYIFSKTGLSEDLRNVFSRLISNTFNSSYVSYEVSVREDYQDHSKFLGVGEYKILTERPILLQRKQLENALMGAALYNRLYPNTYKNIKYTKYNNYREYFAAVTKINLPKNFETICKIHYGDNVNVKDLIKPLVDYVIGQSESTSETIKQPDFNDATKVAEILAIIYGSELNSVIQNNNGDNLPLYQLGSLVYKHREVKQRYSDQENTDVINNNIFFQGNNIEYIGAPHIRTEIKVGDNIVPAAKLNAKDCQTISIVFDFYQSYSKSISHEEAQGKSSNQKWIGLQAHTYADKNRHFVQRYDVNKQWIIGNKSFNLSWVIDAILKANKSIFEIGIVKNFLEAWRTNSHEHYDAQLKQIIVDYKAAGFNVDNLQELKQLLSANKADDIKVAFKARNITFVEEFHGIKNGENLAFNETLEYLLDVFSAEKKFEDFLIKHWKNFRNNIDEKSIREQLGADKDNLNNICKAYFLMDAFLSNEYNSFMVGDIFFHPNKDTDSTETIITTLKNEGIENPTQEQIIQRKAEQCYASRWIAQIKRMVIYGATYHNYAQGLKYGVPEEIEIAIIDDVKASVFNAIGDSDKIDSMDGAGFTSPYLSRMQNKSLLDAAVHDTKKTIYHDIDGKYGRPTLLKWAEYAITNELRRRSKRGGISLDNLFKKMHDKEIKITSYEQEFDNLYVRDEFSSKNYKKINKISISNNIAQIWYDNSELPSETTISTIADLDALFGGAWCGHLDENNKFIFDEQSLDYVYNIICENNLKNKFIGMAINSSACKVGAANVNKASSWSDNTQLNTIQMSTRFGGVQMDADHHINDSEVTEMTQMISALEQNGYTHNLAAEVYKEIGQMCDFMIKDYNDKNKDELYKIFGKAIIKSFQSEKDTLGLAQTFVRLAQEDANKLGINFKIPFSSPSINGIFNSTVTVSLIKSAIRRHYDGIASVLNPSYNVMQYYNFDGKYLTYEELGDVMQEKLQDFVDGGVPLPDITLEDYFSYISPEITINNIVYSNPFVVPMHYDDVDLEDHIVIQNINGTYEEVYIDTFDKYIYYRNFFTGEIYRHLLRPINLKGSKTTFTTTYSQNTDDGRIITDSRTNTTYEHESSQLLYWINEVDFTWNHNSAKNISTKILKSYKDRFSKNFGYDISHTFEYKYFENYVINKIVSAKDNNQSLKEFTLDLKNEYQSFLDGLRNGANIQWRGVSTTVSDVAVHPAEIAMDNLYAEEFGIDPNTNLNEILNDDEYFRKHVASRYTIDDINTDLYDWILFDGKGNKLYVKLGGDTTNPNNRTSSYINIDGDIYFGDDVICNAKNKTFYSRDGVQFCSINDISALEDLKRNFKYTHTNYTESNKEYIYSVKFQGEKNIEGSKKYAEDKLIVHIYDVAKAMKSAFEQSLVFVGTRIPCQSMQSFAPMKVVMFTNTGFNSVYVPPMITWLEGSDYDIDKQYILGYSVEDGQIDINRENESGLKNRTVNGIIKVITNPSNQANLTQPVTTDGIKAIANKSAMGQGAKKMNPYNPYCKFEMQVQNMVGKDVIGVEATAIKSFFALSHMYNEKFNKLSILLTNGEFEGARNLLSTLTVNGVRTLANVNLNSVKTALNIRKDIPEDILNTLNIIIKFNDRLEDVSMVLGQLLNAATDNAKELILKKINSDTTWADLYCIRLMTGDDLEEIGQFMIDPEISEILEGYQTTIFTTDTGRSGQSYLKNLILDQLFVPTAKNTEARKKVSKILDTIHKPDELNAVLLEKGKISKKLIELYCYSAQAAELKTLGRILKINQGIPTKFIDTIEYVRKIEDFVNKKLDDENTTFNLYKFIDDINYQSQMINAYEKVKDNFNILEVIATVPHFKAMFNALGINNHILTTLSSKNKITEAIIRRLYNQGPYYTSVGLEHNQKINEFLIQKWAENSGLTINLPRGFKYKSDRTEKTIAQDTPFGIYQFDIARQYLESKFFPELLKTYSDNAFVKNLRLGVKTENSDTIPFYRLDKDMMKIDLSEQSRKEYDEILDAFNSIAEHNIDDNRIIDMIYLYNLIVNHDKFGPQTFTRLFETIISINNKDLWIYKYNTWLDNPSDNDIQILIDEYSQVHGISANNTESCNYSLVKFGGKTYKIIEGKVIDQNNIRAEEWLSRWIIAKYKEQNGDAVHVVYNNDTYIVTVDGEITVLADKSISPIDQSEVLKLAKEKLEQLRINRQTSYIRTQDSLPFNDPERFDITTISDKTEAFGVVFPKQSKTSSALRSEYSLWQKNNPNGIVAYRISPKYNTYDEVQLGHIGNPFSENARGFKTVQQFYDWLVSGNNFGNEKATEEYRQAIIFKLLSTPINSPILYYTELERPSHATVLGYLIANKQLLAPMLNKQSTNNSVVDDSMDSSAYSLKPESSNDLPESEITEVKSNVSKDKTHDAYMWAYKAKEWLGDRLQIITADEIDDELGANAKAFIKDGVIYINQSQNATEDDLTHELWHIFWGVARSSDPSEYYSILEEVSQSTEIKDMYTTLRKSAEYANKHGSDFDEEILVRSCIEGLLPMPFNLIDKMQLLFTEDPIQKTSMFNNYASYQKVATLKNQLIDRGTIEENCK